ncbi:MAG: hypothetical protein LBT53_01880 [Puniceicoccales bacterium]|jgi:hypothetical protein|nr:hypothetical protein [Puniceicoccales bacterium]
MQEVLGTGSAVSQSRNAGRIPLSDFIGGFEKTFRKRVVFVKGGSPLDFYKEKRRKKVLGTLFVANARKTNRR